MRQVTAARALIAALLVSGLALAACDKFTARPSAKGRFAYLFQTSAVGPDGSPGTQVRLARITAGLTLPRFGRPADPKASDVATLLDTATKTSPTQVDWMGVSPLNTRLLVYSSEVPINALDHNLQVWNVATGTGGALFNEHSAASHVNKTTCPSAVFQTYVATAYPGAPPAVVNALDFKPSVEGMDGANVASPQILGWIDEQKVALKWKFRLQVTDGSALDDTFSIILTWPTGGGPATMVCAPAPAIPSPKTVLTADPVIELRKRPVLFGMQQRKALRIAGNIAP
jgi:hypothetical protein